MSKLINLFKQLSPFKKRQGTVRFMFPALVSFAAVLGAAAITATDASYIRLQPSANTVEEGQQLSIGVYAYAHVPVNAVDITLRFDPSAFKVVSVDKGQSVLTIWTQEPIITGDTVTLRGGTFRKGFLKEHKIATVKLLAKKAGQSSVVTDSVVLLAGDGKGTTVPVAEALGSNVSLYVYDENTDPGSIGVNVGVKIITDIDGDGKVTLRDVSAFMAAWNNKDKIFDFNNDGKMTFRDFSIILADLFFY